MERANEHSEVIVILLQVAQTVRSLTDGSKKWTRLWSFRLLETLLTEKLIYSFPVSSLVIVVQIHTLMLKNGHEKTARYGGETAVCCLTVTPARYGGVAIA